MAKRLVELDDPVVVGIAGGQGCPPTAEVADGVAPEAVPVDLLVLDPPGDADKPGAPGRLAVGTLRGSQPKAIEHVGFAGLVKKLVAPA